MSPDNPDVQAMQAALEDTALRLHGIASRTGTAQVAAEVLRLNDAVRAGALGRIGPHDQPGDFARLLLAQADPANAEDPA
ncbi:hypothetical protein [Variovorax terrae]|uniref:Uncharacterized protein n=1 Tax=Variovorax terrae TaxID=2923278 RepID=A0A9X1VRQ8_9BURK|nr:hypothetical protein [Variovorax terrae]MCJ0762190.1 hypothetical protein [Variovorax terrae]